MTCDAAVRAYCRSVGGALRLQKNRKKEILAGLRRELEERFSGAGTLTVEDISAEVGPYDVVADELMNSVPAEEREQYLSWQKWVSRGVIIALVVLLVASVAYFLDKERTQVVRAEQKIIYLPDEYVFSHSNENG
ncbi:MAG: hypothetical protein HFF73_01150 [Oscillospiraceae bacterium]|nr:hypothetical protein [Oscillospiraceae bacterium]